MGHRLLFLLLSLSLPSCFTSATDDVSSAILLDQFGCTNLHCEWLVEGEQCKFVSTLNKKPMGFPFQLFNGESEEDFLKRIKIWFPLNTFTVVNNIQTEEMCTRKGLNCTMMFGEYGYQLMLGEEGHKEFFERLLHPRVPFRSRTKLNC